MLRGEGRIIVQKDGDGRKRKVLVYIPLDIANDSQFPINENTQASVTLNPINSTLSISFG
jgi:hypothetical protein